MTDKLKKIYGYIKNGELLGIVYEMVFVNFIPERIGAVSIFFYRRIFSNFRTGKNIKCWGTVCIRKTAEGKISIGDNVRIGSDFKRAGIALYSKVKLTVFGNSRIIIGNNVALSGVSITARTTSIEIMDGTIIAPNVIIIDSDFHTLWPPEDRTYRMGYENDRPVKINKNVWIGINSLILKGVTIGENSIIGAGSVVTKDIPPNVLAAGNPAHIIRNLEQK